MGWLSDSSNCQHMSMYIGCFARFGTICKMAPNHATHHISHIFPITFLQSVNGSKNPILNRVMKVNLFMCFFLFVFQTPFKDFPFYSPFLLTLWFRYLQTHIKESCMYVFSQLFFKTPHKTLKFKEKSKPAICRLKFQKKIILCLPWGYLIESLN